ncbi:MAG: hypothetical protein RBG13Loki_3548 [Promethearchaeota archaeon CR_4]|nr:MAG: hypothetical protein RBG13Loki_3548 [Candidatus Lokiarchaeota archaeon CR_4]
MIKLGSYDYEDFSEEHDATSGSGFFKPAATLAKSLLGTTGTSSQAVPATSPTTTVRGQPQKTPLWKKHVKSVAEIKPPKGKVLNVLFAFDVTSSMEMYIGNVTQKMRYLCSELIGMVPDMEISFIGVGDHQDGDFMLQATAFSNDLSELKEDIEAIQMTSGGDDHPEAFECLFKAVNDMNLASTNTMMFLVTDSIPHGMKFRGRDLGCPKDVQYQEELKKIHEDLYGFYIMGASPYREIVKLQMKLVKTPDFFLNLTNYRRVVNIASAIVAQEVNQLTQFLTKLEKERGTDRVREVLRTLGKPLQYYAEVPVMLSVICPKCNVKNLSGSILCNTCGNPLPIEGQQDSQ